MAFLYRIKPLKLKSLSNQYKRCYFEIPRPCLANPAASRTRIGVLNKPNSVIHKSNIEFFNSVRFFAAPVQAKPKKEEKDSSGPRLNEQITAEFIRLVTDEGHTEVSRHEALERARILNLDLVGVQRNAKPPVCKLMDYHKQKYNKQIKEKDRSKSKVIDAYCEILTHEQMITESLHDSIHGPMSYVTIHGKSYFVSSLCLSLASALEPDECNVFLDKQLQGAASYKYIHFPLCYDNHWTLLIYDTEDNHWYHYNSNQP